MKPEDEIARTLPGGRRVWVRADKLSEFDENEKKLAETLAKIQAKNAERQARAFTEEETVFLDKLQNDYLSAKAKRAELARGLELNESVKVYKKPKAEAEIEDSGY